MCSNTPLRLSFAAIAVCAMSLLGCASYQGPRIDPTGERLFTYGPPAPAALPPGIPPGSVPVGPMVPVGAPSVPAAAPPAAVAAPPIAAPVPFGNVNAAPVYSDPTPPPMAPPSAVIPPVPYAPSTAIPGTVSPALTSATVTPAVPVVAPAPGSAPAPTTPPGSTFVRLTPDRLVAPVGSEVFLKAGVAGPDGSLAPNERIEWSVARNGVGQLGTMGLNETGHLFTWWAAPEKLDQWTAVGRTAFYPISVAGATPGPYGEAQIDRGESWVTLTSCNEGVSQVTAFAPSLCQYNQATTSIYWIDAQWTLPASVVAECGKPHVLTTTVFRRTNGTPLAGWIVRYTVGSGGSLGYEGGNTVDARTDAAGRASVEVSTSQAGGGVTQVGITIIHPQSVDPNALPQVELTRGAAAITWSTNAPPAVVPVPVAPVGPPPGLPTAPPTTSVPLGPPPSPINSPPPSLPSTPQPTPANVSPGTNAAQPSPVAPPPAGRPRLETTMRPTSAEQVAVGQYVSWELTITNRGDGVARHIEVVDRFDMGLRHPNDTRNTHSISNSNIRELAPNDSERITLTFQVVEAGRQCHRVTVAADGAEAAPQQGCAVGTQTSLEVKVSGEYRRTVGETTTFTVSIRNTGSTAAGNVELRVAFDPAGTIEPVIESGMERMQDGSILVRLNGELAPGEKRSGLRIQGRCVAPSTHACAKASVSSMGGATSQDEACLEILPVNNTAP